MNRPDDPTGPVTVFRTNDPGLLVIAKSLLDDAGIAYLVAGEELQSLFAGGHMLSDFTPSIRVAAEDAADARQLLRELGGSTEDDARDAAHE
jgi:hypothetical protein